MSKVLLVGLNKIDLTRIKRIFGQVQVPADVANSFEMAESRITSDPPMVVIANYTGRLEEIHGLKENLKVHAPNSQLVVLLPEYNSPTALKLMNAGAYDCIAKPYAALDVLAASKRAALIKGRALITHKIGPRRRPMLKPILTSFISLLVLLVMLRASYGPPADTISLGSAHLTGLQWDGRTLWVGDWFDSNIIRYKVDRGLLKRWRELKADGLYKLTDSQPMLVCNTEESLYTIGTDLKIRSHQRIVGLPVVQSERVPGNQPTGLAFDGKNLWSVDQGTNLIYRHGEDLSVLDQIPSILANPQALTVYDGDLWVAGESPLKLARLEFVESGYVWHGPYDGRNLLAENVIPTGLALGFDRVWMVSGGYPMMVSGPLKDIMDQPIGWRDLQKKGEKS